MNVTDTVDYVDRFQRRVLQDALASAVPAFWRNRAEQFVKVGTPACFEIAAACLNAASFWEGRFDAIICPVCGTPTSPWTCSCGETRVGDAA